MLLSILIPTVKGREIQLDRLIEYLLKQKSDEVEIIVLKDNKEMTIGEKRNKLYQMANGEYSIQIDDDDLVAPDFITKVLTALETKPDCVCYFEKVIYNGITKVSCHSNDFADWGENYKEGDNFYHYIRTPFFKDVIKTDICKAVPVQHIRYAEDIQWARDLKKSGLIKTEVFINDYLYYYSYTNQTESQMRERYGIK